MSRLTVYRQDQPQSHLIDTDNAAEITKALNSVGVRFERWSAQRKLSAQATPEEIAEVYGEEIRRLQEEKGYQTWDVISLYPEHPDKDALRKKFLDEHSHSEDEVRFFVDGQGLFTLHIEEKVYAVLCVSGDLISVPAGTTHWFDMGPNPNFKVIRVFDNQEGWVAKFTGSDIASRFARLDN